MSPLFASAHGAVASTYLFVAATSSKIASSARCGAMSSRWAAASFEAFSATDFTEDLKAIAVPTLVMHGDDDQIVPIVAAAELSIKLLKHGTLKVYKGYPHGMLTTHADVLNPDLLAFIKA